MLCYCSLGNVIRRKCSRVSISQFPDRAQANFARLGWVAIAYLITEDAYLIADKFLLNLILIFTGVEFRFQVLKEILSL